MQTISRTRRSVIALALSAALATPALVVTTQALTDRADAAAAPAASAAAAATTRVVLRVSGCDGCGITAHTLLDTPGPGFAPLWTSRSKKVRDGKVRFTVPTASTTGLSFSLTAPFEGYTGAVSAIVLGYRGLAPGTTVGAQQAAAATRGSVCLAGAPSGRLTLDVAVVPVKTEGNGPDGVPVTAAAAFATTTQKTLRPYLRTFNGYTGSQDVPPCTAP